jgi:hypothetical protein
MLGKKIKIVQLEGCCRMVVDYEIVSDKIYPSSTSSLVFSSYIHHSTPLHPTVRSFATFSQNNKSLAKLKIVNP